MKVQLVKSDTKFTFGDEENGFDYFVRPLTLEEKTRVNSHIVWSDKDGGPSVDFTKTDQTELVKLGVTKIDRLVDSDDCKIDTIEKFLSAKIEPGVVDGAVFAMWVNILSLTNLSPELKKKLSQDSTQAELK